MNQPTIEEAIEKNLNISFVEPGDNDEVVTVTRTCKEVLEEGRIYMDRLAKERPEITTALAEKFPEGYPDREIVLDYLAVHWAKIEPR